MLTVDYRRLGLRSGERVLDLGCGFGRHGFESLRRGAQVVACDMALPELTSVRSTVGAMRAAGELVDTTPLDTVAGDAQSLPFADECFDRIIASEVLEHVPDDTAALSELARVLRPGGVLAATVPSFVPEKICWALADDYHAPAVPGGHVRIYSQRELTRRMRDAGLTPIGHHRAHALHSPYWWLKCAVGVDNDENPLVRQYHRFLTWDIVERPTATRVAERVLAPILGKSLVIYAQRPAAASEMHS